MSESEGGAGVRSGGWLVDDSRLIVGGIVAVDSRVIVLGVADDDSRVIVVGIDIDDPRVIVDGVKKTGSVPALSSSPMQSLSLGRGGFWTIFQFGHRYPCSLVGYWYPRL